MPQTFRIDGKTHAVEDGDVLVIEGPSEWDGNYSGKIVLSPGDTITMTVGELEPGRGDHDHMQQISTDDILSANGPCTAARNCASRPCSVDNERADDLPPPSCC